jgi:formate dehydrogenase subunit delta
MKAELMVHNANQIALYFASFPKEDAVAGVTDHILKFWEKRIKQQLASYVEQGGAGIHELVLEAEKRLRAA